MRTTHKFTLTSIATIATISRGRAAALTCAFVVMMALGFALTPASARQGMALRISQSQTAARLLSYAPAPIRNTVGARLGMKSIPTFAPLAPASAVNSSMMMLGTDIGVNVTSSVNAAGSAGGNNAFAGRARIDFDIAITNVSATVNATAGEVTVTAPGVANILADPNLEIVGFTSGGFAGCNPMLLSTTGCPNTGNITIAGANQTRNITFTVRVASNNQAGKILTVNPTLTLNPPGGADVAGNNADTESWTIANDGNLQIAKDANPVSYPGGFITYTLIAQNLGTAWNVGDAGQPGAGFNSTMYDNRVTDPMPAEIGEIISITPGTGWSCTPLLLPILVNPLATTVTCDQNAGLGLAPGAPAATVATIVVKTKLNLINGQVVTNTATIVEDPVPAGIVVPSSDSDSDSTVIRLAADLSINKVPALTAVTAGGASVPFAAAGTGLPAGGLGDITYVLAVANAGPGDALNVAVLDNLPANTILVSPPALDPATVTINGTPQPTFVMPCAGTTQFSCVPGNNAAINPNFIAGVLPNKFAGLIRYRVRVPANVAQGTIIQNVASVNSSSPGDPTAQTPDPNAGNNVSLPTQVLVNASTDLGIAKSADKASITAGQAGAAGQVTYTITVSNAGASDAQNVVVTDALPAGLVFVSASTTGGFSCQGPNPGQNGTLTCSNPLFAAPTTPGGAATTATITVVARAAQGAAAGVRNNTATVATSTTESGVLPNSATDSPGVTVVTDADLTVTKTGTPTSVVAGANITYTINITNNGPSRALNVALTDTFPANTTFVSSNGTGILAGCSGGASLSCPTANLDAGESASLTIVLRVNPDAAAGVGALSNTANLAWTDSDPDADTATSTFTSDVTRSTDLSITKNDSPDAITAGNDIIYTIKVKNNGPSTAAANAVTVTDATPANTTDVSVSGTGVFSGCNSPAALHTGCLNAGGPMQPGEEAVITYRVTVNPNAPNGFITNIASVTAAEDGNATNNEAVRQTAVGPSVDLAITKTADTANINGIPLGQVVAGGTSNATGALGTGNIEYTLNYRNNGPSDAVNVHVRDVRPGNSAFVPGSIQITTGSGPAMSCSFIVALSVQQLDCTPSGGGTLPPGANGTVTFRVSVPADVADNTVIENQATINSEGFNPPATPDPDGGNNTSVETRNTVRARADVTIAKTDTPDPVIAGQNVTYTLDVRNLTPSTTPANLLTGSNARDAVVTDALPAGVTFVSASSSAGWVCTNANNSVTCNKAVFDAGAQETITITGKVNSNVANGSSLGNTATIASSTDEPGGILNVGPNSSTAATAVVTDAAVAITKADQPDIVIAGNNITYTMTVTNNGSSDAIDLRLSDPLPANVSFVSFNGTGIFGAAGACNQVGNTVTCGQPAGPNLTLPAGASANLTIVGKVASSVPALTVLSNTATVTWQDSNAAIGATALNTTNAVTTTTVRHQSDLSLKKEAPEEVIAGQRMDYTLTLKNLGASDVLGGANPGTVTVEDTLPAGVMAIEPMTAPNTIVSGPGGFTCSYTMATNKVVCVNAAGAPGNVPNGATVTIVFKVKTDPGLKDGENLNNCARITAPIVSSDPAAAIETDPNGGNNESCDSTVVRTQADLGIYKSAAPKTPVAGSNPPAVKAGENIVYTLEFGNAGPSNAQNVRITDLIPGNTSYVTPVTPFTILAAGGLYTGANSVNISCDRVPAGSNNLVCVPKGNSGLTPALADGELPAGVQSVIVYEVKVNESVTGGTIIANAAKITSADGGTQPSTPDPNPGNNTSLTTSTPVIAASQLVVSKVVKSSTAAVDPGAPAGAVIPGTFLTYEITVRNNGPSDVSNLRVIDTLPLINPDSVGRATGVKYISVTQTTGFGTTFTCAPPTGVNPSNNPQGNGGSLQCTAPLMSANAPNNEAKLEVVVFIDPATKSALVNKVDANATINNFNQPVSSSATLTTPVSPTSDLAVTKTHAPDPVIAGTEFEYTITVTNNGQSTAQMVNLVDELPPYQSIVSTQITQTPDGNGAPAFTCTPSFIAAPAPGHARLTCTAAELPPNKRQDGTANPAGTVTFKVRVKQSSLTPQPTPTSYQNCVTATSMSYDPVVANSTNVCDTVNIIFRADLLGGKVDTPDPVIAGQTLTYTITAGNKGPSAALNFMISDPLPAGTVFISATAPGSTTLTTPAVDANGLVKATWAGLTDTGVERVLTIVVRVCADYEQSFLPSGKKMCEPNLTNTASVTSDTPEELAQLTDNNPSATTTVQAQSDLSIAKSAPAQAQHSVTGSPSNITYTLSFSNAGPSNSAGTKIVDVLPKGFTVVGQPTSTVPGTTFEITTVNGVTTVTANLGVLGAANQCQANRPVSGTVTIVANVPIKHPVITVTNTATISTANCLADPNLANNTSSADTKIVMPGTDPGVSFPALSEVTDTKAGSVLFFPVYTSDAVNANTQNTRISLTNVSASERAYVHIFAVDGSSCAVLDAFLCLTPNQTTTFLASDFDPGNTGYLMAVAVDGDNGLPIAFNCLIGDQFVKFASGHQASLGAEAIAASMMYPGGTNPNVTTTQLKFDGSNYNRLPRVLGLGNIPSPADGNSTMLIVNRVGGNFTVGGAAVGPINGLLFDDAEVSYSFTAAPGSCQYRSVLSNSFPRTFTPFSRIIPAGRTGWMKFWAVEDRGLFGAAINHNASANANSGAFNQGHNLHHLTLTDAVTITVPVFIPSC